MFWIRDELRASHMKYKIDIFAKIAHWYGPSTIFVKISISNVPLSLNTTLQIASHYCETTEELTSTAFKEFAHY